MRVTTALTLSTALLTLGTVYGCASSAPEGGAATEEAAPGAPAPQIGGSGPSSPPPGTPIADLSDAGVKEGGGGTGGGDGGGASKEGGATSNPYCVVGSTAELESNDTPVTATPISGSSFCGVLSSATDVDYGSFTLPLTATSFNFNLHLAKSTDVFINVKGQHVPIAGTKLPFEPGEKYTIEVRPKGGQAGAWRVDVSMK